MECVLRIKKIDLWSGTIDEHFLKGFHHLPAHVFYIRLVSGSDALYRQLELGRRRAPEVDLELLMADHIQGNLLFDHGHLLDIF